MHLDPNAFLPATEEDKQYISRMRPSSTFFKDGCKRLLKNKVATISLILILLITLSSIVLPMVWPYSYDAMLGVRPGKPVDASYNTALTPTAVTTSSVSSTAPAFPSRSASLPASLFSSSA